MCASSTSTINSTIENECPKCGHTMYNGTCSDIQFCGYEAQTVDVHLYRNNKLIKSLCLSLEEYDRRIDRYRTRCEQAGKPYTVVHPFKGVVEIHKAA